MHPEPADEAIVERMRAAHRYARSSLDVRPAPDAREAWGWRGRTLGGPVTTVDGPAWLRIASARRGHVAQTFWDGSLDAAKAVPTTIPRPRLLAHEDWTDSECEYRAELYEHVAASPISRRPLLTEPVDLSDRWWTELRTAVDTIVTVTTDRYTIEQRYLDWAMPTYLGVDLDTRVLSWTTAHGDLHWANLCGPDLEILDWEGWGLAPTGYDAATLHSHTLLSPDVATRVRSAFAGTLDTPAGRFAELVAITEVIHKAAASDDLIDIEPLHERAAHLLAAQSG